MQEQGSSTGQAYQFNSRETIGQAFITRKVPREAIDILLASLSVATLKQYESALRLWWVFCKHSKDAFFKPSVNKILRFLSEQFRDGASYGTLNTYRSAISLISRTKIGENGMIRRFLKGVFHMRPTKPRYTLTWDVFIVLRYLEGLHPLETLSFRQLTEKTVTLLALCTAHRAQTLASILITHIHTTCTGLHITVDERIKTSGPGRFQSLLILPMFQENPSLCVATVLRIFRSYRDFTG